MSFSAAAANLFQGTLIGLFIAVPVGPSSILCIQRCLSLGLSVGLATGLGIASVHGVYAGLVLQGSRGIASFVASHPDAFRLASVSLLFIFAARALRLSEPRFESLPEWASSPETRYRGVDPASSDAATETRWWIRIASAYGSALVFGAINPMTIFFFLAVIPPMLAIGGDGGAGEAAWWLVVGVTLGSLGWWSLLVLGVRMASRLIVGENFVRIVNRALALSLALMGLALLMPAWPESPAADPDLGHRRSQPAGAIRRSATFQRAPVDRLRVAATTS